LKSDFLNSNEKNISWKSAGNQVENEWNAINSERKRRQVTFLKSSLSPFLSMDEIWKIKKGSFLPLLFPSLAACPFPLLGQRVKGRGL